MRWKVFVLTILGIISVVFAFFLVYRFYPGQGTVSWVTAFATLMVVYILMSQKFKSKDIVAKNLHISEKPVVAYLGKQKNKTSWKKNMIEDLNISKGTLDRKLKILEEKGLIKRIPYGNKKRILLLHG